MSHGTTSAENSLWRDFLQSSRRSFGQMLRQEWYGISMAVLLALVILGPMLNVFLWAFTQRWRYPALLPTEWGIRFWADTFARADITEGFITSLYTSFFVTLLSALICLPAAYAFARLNFPGRTPLLLSFLATNAFPRFGLYVTIAVIFFRLQLVGTVAGVVLIQLINTLLFMIWIPTAAFQGVDRTLEEAALDVGASRLRVFIQITLPLVLPALSAALLLTFVGAFYETQGALLIGVPNVRTLPVVMILLINNQVVVQYGAILSVVLWIPSVILLVFAQRVLRGGTLAAGFGV
ncbi:MAG TPA: ABC transporter permease subunit [Caldilineaceae bacterium]|nr:carbohydrate ABC transporter permease [Caldilineaceae bacterium]HRW05360.1 ABC transporter permease subunit [Caldilineaceae bacterium]